MQVCNRAQFRPAADRYHRGLVATILIVDDRPANRRFLVTLLSPHGHRVLEAANGRDALLSVQADPPDLVITDVLMPVMDGYEFVRRLRVDPAFARIPVLFYTAPYGEREARAYARSNGLPYVLTKPAHPDEVLKIVSRVLAGEADAVDDAPETIDIDRDHLRLLTDRLSEKTEDLKDANARLRALINIGLDLASSHGSDRLLESVCDAACDLFGTSYVTLGIVDRDHKTVRRFAACGTEGPYWTRTGDEISGMIETVVAEGRTLRGENPGGDPASLGLPAGHPEVRAFLAAPIASRAQVYGWICLVCNDEVAFTEFDEPLVMVLAGQVGRIYELEYQILERKQAEAALRHERERMRFTLEATGVGIWEMDLATGSVRWSETVEAHYGLQPGTFGGSFEAFIEHIHPDDRRVVRDTVEAAMRSASDFSFQNRSVWPDGTVRWLSSAGRFQPGEHGEQGHGVGISQDVTERRILDEESLHGQKMEAVGHLAGGVAHDFNNLLTAILGYCELLQADLPPGDPHLSDIAQIHKAGASAAGLTGQLLAFSRKQIIEPSSFDLNSVVDGMQEMLGRLIREDVKIVLRLQPEPVSVKADRGQTEQIIMNLAVNARDAMAGGGTLTIETASVELDEHYAKVHRSVRPGPYVVLTVSDTGSGMSPQVQARVFDPFFTTKERGKGTGLGLATVHGIATRGGGTVNVYSEPGKGTSFKVYFPRAAAADISSETPLRVHRPDFGDETVLVVEDAAELRELTRRLLERHGYTVLLAGNAEEAVEVFDANEGIGLLLTDVVMPGAGGPELSQRLVGRQPTLKVIFMSGYTEATIVHDGILNPGIAFLHKPFTSETLGRKVREVLDRQPQPIARLG